MKRGHVVGTKREQPGAQDWYREVESQTLRQLDAAAVQSPTPAEVSHEKDAPDA